MKNPPEQAQSEQTQYNVALIGNPNTGKSTLFGALVGIHQHVGNYPGVTVEKKTGHVEHGDRHFELIDLPGLYSLAPRSRDEMVAVDLLLGRRSGEPPVDLVLCVVDASNLERNLYLVSQVLELGLPTVLAVNMLDVAEKHGVEIDIEQLGERLATPVVAVQANRRRGISRLKEALAEAIDADVSPRQSPFPELFQRETRQLAQRLADRKDQDHELPEYLVERLLLDSSGYLESTLLSDDETALKADVESARSRLDEAGHTVPGVETTARYDWARRMLDGIVLEPQRYGVTASDRIDRVLTHRFWGIAIFATLMVVVFQAVFSGGEPLMALVEGVAETVGGWIEAHLDEGALQSLLVDGVVGGVGGVLVFLPQILILFLFIAILEDCGYMARAAFLMDKMMVRVGLSGKSFIPMLSSFACAIPGIMAARVIENERDRLTTILVAPLLTCSARLPVYTLLIAAFIPSRGYLGGLLNLQGLTLIGLYLLGIVTAIVVALVLKRTLLRGDPPPFLMELPSYKWPSIRTVVYRVVHRGWLFLRCAGTLILFVSIVVWAALYYPHDTESVEGPFRADREATFNELATIEETAYLGTAYLEMGTSREQSLEAHLLQIDREIIGEYQRQSYLGRAGRVIEPIVEPLGWDWRIGCAVIASFPAREIVVATLGVIYNLGDDVDTESEEGAAGLTAKLHSATWDDSHPPRKVFTLPVALSLLVFFALCAQCAATLAVIRRETNSWRWPAFTFGYMTTLAYVGALLTYQIGTWIAT